MEPPISSLIASAERGDRAAADALFAALYSDLHRLAKRQLACSGGRVTIGATTLLHEAYFMYWRSDHSQSQWESTLAELEAIAGASTSSAKTARRA